MDKYISFFKDLCARRKLDDFQILIHRSNNLNIQGKNKEASINSERDLYTVSIRILKNKKISQVSATSLSQERLTYMLERARKLMQNSVIKEFPVYSKYPSPELYDSKVNELMENPERIFSIHGEMVERAFKTDRKGLIKTLLSSFSVSIKEVWFFSSKMKEPIYSKSSFYSAYISVNSVDYDFIVDGRWDEEKVLNFSSRFMKFYPEKEFSKEEFPLNGKVPVILHPALISSLFGTLISEHLYASSFINGTSRLSRGESYFSKNITVVDDGTAPFMMGSNPVDDEGVPSRRNLLFKEGVFVDYLYDLKSAYELNHEPTGNGVHRPTLIESYEESPIRCGIRNLIMENGKRSVDDMLKDIDRGLYLKGLLGIHTADKVGGSFSNPVSVGYIIKNGKIIGRTQQGVWGVRGKIDELLKDGIPSKESLHLGQARFPWIKTEIEVM